MTSICPTSIVCNEYNMGQYGMHIQLYCQLKALVNRITEILCFYVVLSKTNFSLVAAKTKLKPNFYIVAILKLRQKTKINLLSVLKQHWIYVVTIS